MALSRLAFAALLAAAHSPAFGAAHLTVENFVGNLIVENAASATEITARVEPGAGAVPAPLVSGGGLALVIDGGFDVDSVRCGAGNVPAVEIGGDAVSIGRLPVVRVRAPIDVDVVITASAPFGAIGEVSNLVLAVEGCAVFNAGVVRDLLEARIDGGGALRVRRAEDAVIRTRGTVELTVGEVVRTARIDLEGRGNVSIGSVRGRLEINSAGTGNVEVALGAATPLHVFSRGPGGVVFGGTAHGGSVTVRGTGDVRVSRTEGPIEVDRRGRGRIVIGE